MACFLRAILIVDKIPRFYNISMKNTWYYPSYYPLFSCKADRCRHSCCSSWRIPVSRKEYESLLNMECSDELYSRVLRAFEVPEIITEDCFRYICFNWLGECPIQDKGLCALHREKGPQFLPKICRLYPRSLKKVNGFDFVSCSSSCEAVVELLYDNDLMAFSSGVLDEEPEIVHEISSESIEQIKKFHEIIKDRTTTLAESLESICRIVNEDEFNRDFMSGTDPLREALRVLGRLRDSNDRLEEIAGPVLDRYLSSPEMYEQDAECFERDYPEWMPFFERVINNSMMYELFPFVDSRFDSTMSYKGLCVCYGLLRVLCIGNHHFHDDKDSLIDAVSALFHLIDHTSFYFNVTVLTDNAAVMLKL